MAEETERCGEPMPDRVSLPIGTALPQAQHTASGLSADHRLSPPCPSVLRNAGPCRDWLSIPEYSGHGPHPTTDCDLEALTLSELKNMQKDVAEAISTFEDHQNAEARAKVEASAREPIYLLAELVGTET